MVDDGEFLNRIRSLLKIYPRGLTISEISQRLKFNRNSVAKYLEILQISGIVEMQQMGAAKVFFLSHRIPLSNLLGFTKEGIIVIAVDGRVVQINERFCRMFELDPGSVSGMSVEMLPDDITRAFSFDLYLKPDFESEHTAVITFIKYDWRRYFKVKYLKTVFDDGKSGLTVIVEDITLETEMEERLRLNEARFRGIVEDQTELICRYGHDGVISFANGAFCRHLNMSPSEAVRHSLFDFLSEPVKEQIQNGMSLCSVSNPVFEVEFELKCPGGRFRWYHWVTRALTDDDGRIIEYQGVGRDITDRKFTERELRIKSHAMDSSIIPISLASLEGLITYVNTAFLQMWGYRGPDEVIGLPLEHFAQINAESLSKILHVRQNVSEKNGFSGEISGTKKDGKRISLSVTISVVHDAQNSPICLIAYFHDITNQVRMVKELEIKDTAISHSYEGMAIITPEDTVMYANPSFQRLFSRVPGGKFIGSSIEWCFSFYPQIISSISEFRASLNEKGNYTRIFSDIDEQGVKWVIQMHMSRAYDRSGNHICTLVSVLDITNQRATEESLALLVRQLEGTVEQMGDPTFIISRDHMVVAWNEAMEVLTGIRKQEMIGSSRYHEMIRRKNPSLPILVDLFELSPKELIQKFPHISRVGSSFYTEAYVSGFNESKGTYVWVKASPIVDNAGKVIGIIQNMKDMTNWKRAVEAASVRI